MPNPTEADAKGVLTTFLQSPTPEDFYATLSAAQATEIWTEISKLEEPPIVDSQDDQGGQYLRTAWHLSQALAQAQSLTNPLELPGVIQKINDDSRDVLGILACTMLRDGLTFNTKIREAIIGFDPKTSKETFETRAREQVVSNCGGDPEDHSDVADGFGK